MSLMEVTVEIPEDIARQLHAKWDNLPRGVLESLALEAYRSRAITAAQLRRLAHFTSRIGDDWKGAASGYRVLVLDPSGDRETERSFLAEPGVRPLYRNESVSVLLRSP